METTPGPSWKTLLITFAICLLLAGAFLVIANLTGTWPYDRTKQETTDWQNYTNEPYKFSLSYPQSWHYQECRDSGPGGTYLLVSFGTAQNLVICNSDAPLQGIVTITAAPGEIIEQEITSTLDALANSKRSTVTIDGQTTTRLEGTTRQLDGHGPQSGQHQIMLLAEKGGILYRFIYIGSTADAQLFEDVVTSFQFGDCKLQQVQCITTPCYPQLMCSDENLLDNGIISEQEYTNKKYGFKIEMPKEWGAYKVTDNIFEAHSYLCFTLSNSPFCVMQIVMLTPKQFNNFIREYPAEASNYDYKNDKILL